MKKNAIGHMHPEKKGFLSFWKRIHIVQLLLCLLLAVILWLLVVNYNEAKKAEDQDLKGDAAIESVIHAI